MDYSKDGNTKKQKQLKSKNKKIQNKINISILRAFIIAVVLVAIVGAGALLGALKGIIEGAPDIDQIKVAPTGYATIIYDQNGNEITKLVGEQANRIYVEIDQIPKNLQNAVIAIEDERFREHNGVDVKGMFRALFINLKKRSLSEGASTITQQLIKNNVLEDPSKNFERKIQEQYLAIQLEKRMSKDQILEYYMNSMNLGAGAWGVQSASHRYFNKDVWELSISESAVIAAIFQTPTRMNPIKYPENNKVRQQIILSKLYEQGMITKEEYDEAKADDVYSRIQEVSVEYAPESAYSYFVDDVIQRVIEDLKLQKGWTDAQATNMVYRGGLSIYVTQDLALQKVCDDIFTNEESFPAKNVDYGVALTYRISIKKADGTTKHYSETTLENHFKADNRKFNLLFKDEEDANNHIEEYKKSIVEPGDEVIAERVNLIPQPQASMVVIDHHTGQVKAIVGGRGEKEGNRTLSRATDTTRQPGSTFKTLAAYLPALDTAGFTLATVIDDAPFNYPNGGRPVKNWYSGYKGLSTIREGIANSMNILAVKTLNDIGPQLGYDYLRNLGFTTVYDKYTGGDGGVYSDINLSMALGGLTKGVSNLELTAAYAAIANGGVYIEPTFYTKILDHDGKLLLEKVPETRRVMKESTAFLLTSAMEDVVKSSIGTGTAVAFKKVKMPISGKTGTTSSNNDLWFSGYTPYYTASIWTGYDINTSIGKNKNYHKIMWREIMEAIHKDLPYKNFDKPTTIVTAKICTESGLLAVDGLCDNDPRGSTIRTEYFAKGTEPTEVCNVHVKAVICSSSGKLATEYCPDSTKMEKVFIVKPNSDSATAETNDSPYQMPTDLANSTCTVHGSNTIPNIPTIPTIPNNPSDNNGNGNNGNGNNGNGNGNNGNGNNGNTNNGNKGNNNDEVPPPINILP